MINYRIGCEDDHQWSVEKDTFKLF